MSILISSVFSKLANGHLACNVPQMISAINFVRTEPKLLKEFIHKKMLERMPIRGVDGDTNCYYNALDFMGKQTKLAPLKESIGASLVSQDLVFELVSNSNLTAKQTTALIENQLGKYGKFSEDSNLRVLGNVGEGNFSYCIDYVINWIFNCEGKNTNKRDAIFDSQINQVGVFVDSGFAVMIGLDDYISGDKENPQNRIFRSDEGNSYDALSDFQMISKELGLTEEFRKPIKQSEIKNEQATMTEIKDSMKIRKPGKPINEQNPVVLTYLKVLDLVQSDNSADCVIGSIENVIGDFNTAVKKTEYRCENYSPCMFYPSYSLKGKCLWSAACCRDGYIFKVDNRVGLQRQRKYTPAHFIRSDKSVRCSEASEDNTIEIFTPEVRRTNFKCEKDTNCEFFKPYSKNSRCFWSAVCCKDGFVYMAENELTTIKKSNRPFR